MTGTPLVTIGMPVRNEARFLALALEALLGQSYRNLEILVSDNGSSDETGEICLEFAARDDRITYFRQERNIGSPANFQAVLERARGKYFMWASGHDLWSENLVEKCVEQLESDPRVMLAFGSLFWIDEEGKQMARRSGWLDTRGLNPFSRYFITFWGSMNPVLSVIRTEALRRCGGFKSMVGADLVILTALALQGSFAHQLDCRWFRREFRHESSYREKVERYKSSEYGQVKTGLDKLLPLARLPFSLTAVIFRSDLSLAGKLILALTAALTMPARFVSGKATSDHQ